MQICKDYGIAEPEWSVTNFDVTITFWRNGNCPKDFPKDFPKELSERQELILRMIAEDNTITSQKIAQKISPDETVTSRTIKKDLAVLQQMGIIKREGGRKQGHWVIL